MHVFTYTRTQRQIELEKDPERLTATLRQILRQIKVIDVSYRDLLAWKPITAGEGETIYYYYEVHAAGGGETGMWLGNPRGTPQ